MMEIIFFIFNTKSLAGFTLESDSHLVKVKTGKSLINVSLFIN